MAGGSEPARARRDGVLERWTNRAGAWMAQPLRWTTVYRGTISEARRLAKVLEKAKIATNLVVPDDLQLASSDMLLQVPRRLESQARRLVRHLED